MASSDERLARLRELVDGEVYDEDARLVLSGARMCPRFALVTSEGSAESAYADNPNLSVHETAVELGDAAAGEYGEGWCVRQMVDLDTGEDLGWTVRVEVASC